MKKEAFFDYFIVIFCRFPFFLSTRISRLAPVHHQHYPIKFMGFSYILQLSPSICTVHVMALLLLLSIVDHHVRMYNLSAILVLLLFCFRSKILTKKKKLFCLL